MHEPRNELGRQPEQQPEQEYHPDAAALDRFARAELEPRERARVIRHLLTGCETCLRAARRVWGFGPEGLAPLPATAYDQVFDRLARRAGTMDSR
jgi:hypothetical protein